MRPGVTITLPRGDRRYFVDEDDVRIVLNRLPAEVTSRCRAVHFNDRFEGGDCLGYTNRGRLEIALTALPPRISLSRFLVPPQRAETFGARKGAQWPPLAVRRFLLYDVLLHEIGHLQAVHPLARSERRKFAREPKAQEFADTWRERLWADPLAHDDPVHRAPSVEEIAALGAYPEAHDAYRRGLATSGAEALGHHARAAALFPGHALALERLGWDAACDGDARTEEAARHLRAALRVDPILPMANVALSMTLLRMNRPEEARQHLARARRQITLSGQGLQRYANALADGGFLRMAERFFERARELAPESAAILIDHAWAIRELASADDASTRRAIALFERAVAQNPQSARAHLALAETLATQRPEASRALHHAEEALRLRPDDKEAEKLATRLRATVGERLDGH